MLKRALRFAVACSTASLITLTALPAHAQTYWNLFNAEGDTTSDAVYITYATLTDMLNDTNRTGFGVPDGGFAGTQVVGAGTDGTTYWNLFNAEGDITSDAIYITYSTLTDMLNDTNRTGFGIPDGGFAGTQIVGTGSDGSVYWSLFNAESDISSDAIYITYATLSDMLNDTNRTGFGVPDGGFAGTQIVGTGYDGTAYWSVFNAEGDISSDAVIITYATLMDMLNDTNRTGFGVPDGGFAGTQVIDSGATLAGLRAVPEPATWAMMLMGFGTIGYSMRRYRKQTIAQAA